VRHFSQFKTVNEVTPRTFPVCFWERPSSSRRFLIRSPKVFGSKSKGFFLKALRQIRTYGKRAMQLCLCGFLGHHNGKCRCTPDQIARYRNKISGPLLDRIDIQIEVPAVPQDDIVNKADGESSSVLQARVEIARQRQLARQGKPNAQLSVTEIDTWCAPDTQGEALLRLAMTRLSLSARAYHRVLKVARTIADLADSKNILTQHIAEAVQYRRMDKQG
jgi:magnesium chelatase family protein